MAYMLINERITIHEIVVFAMSTVGIVLLSRSGNKSDDKKEVSGELLGVILCLIAAVMANLSTLALRQM